MYSIVLLAAMTSGGDVAASHHGGCGGCGGGHGFCGGLFKSHGCGGCGGCEGGCGGGHGFCGGLFKCFHRSHGCGCEAPAPVCGCCGAEPAPVCGCNGGEVVTETVTDGDAVTEEGDDADEETKVSAPAKLIVSVPAGAKLTIDGAVTKSTSARRVFVSPKLAAGKVYTYTLTTEIDSKIVTKTVEVRAGATTSVQLNVAAPAVASR